ncbi:chemotaxis protein CheA [Pseudomarimonas arenosa]|uniref:Chemotaxis protein CheA n=1 Tax=Pseudomarimonas arenosa TaxID=2774145 RepID=A0AAW3ZK94_9GAMM|nr:chemotaxis protein CheA [Pseudomarimonas arenosa]MBD8524721.1 chemotaxis protein CheA [Pseudomarimonas arenosa]
MSDMMDDIAQDFLIEAQEIAARLGEELVSLERSPTDSELLNAVFRGFHTIKGGAGFLNLKPMVELCHALEEQFGEVRAGKRLLDPELCDGAQEALDHVVRMLAELGAGVELQPAPDGLMVRLARAEAGGPPAPAAAATPTAAKSEDITEQEFDQLLDHLAGKGPAPTAPVANSATRAAPPAPSRRAAAAAKSKPSEATKEVGVETTIRIDTKRLDAIVNLVGELVLVRNRLKTLRGGSRRDDEVDRVVASLDVSVTRLQSAVMKTRMQPVGRVFSRFPKVARDVARAVKKEVELELQGAETELDRTLVESLADPLVHLVRNAIDHGVEAPDVRERVGKPRMGRVVLAARQEGDHIAIEVRDDGGGIDPEVIKTKAREKGLIDADTAARLGPEECLQLIFLPGFSTKAEVTDISGRGVGMDVVQSKIRELNGRVTIHSKLGEGSRFLIRVPLTLAILPALLVHTCGRVFALPLASVQEVLPFQPEMLRWVDGREILDLRQHPLPLIFLRRWLGEPPSESTSHVVLLVTGEGLLGLVVDQVRGREEVVIKPLPRSLREVKGHVGATLTGDGRMALILDVDALAHS